MTIALRIKFFLTAGVICSAAGFPQSKLSATDTLSVERAVMIALEKHPSIRSARAGLRSATAGVTLAMSLYFPALAATATATRTDGWFVFNPAFAPRRQSYNNYSAGIQASQNIFDFGRTINKVRAGNIMLEAAEADIVAVRSSVTANVHLAYYGVIQAVQMVRVTEEAVERAAGHLKQAQAFYSVGKRARFDVTRADVELATANVSLIRARNQLRLAKLGLENAMGMRVRSDYAVSDEFSVEKYTVPPDSIRLASEKMRPELIAARARADAGEALASAAWDQHLPSIYASGSFNWSNFDFPLYSRWNAGITMSLPLFQGGGVSAQAEQARAAADAARADLEQLEESVALEIEQYYLNMKEAEERITAASKLVEQADENLNLAEKQYAAGVGSTIEIADAQLALSNARTTKIQALYDYNSFLIRLKRASGTLR